jgi:hypothetical protein
VQSASVTDFTPIIAELRNAHREATDDFNRWRGRCVDCFARIEEAIKATLSAMASATERGESVRIPPLFGQRVEALQKAIDSAGPFAQEGKSVRKALLEIERWLANRNLLVHGVGSIWINASGEWLWSYRFASNGKALVRETGVIDQDIGRAMEKALASGTRSLCDHLGNLATKLS